MSSIPDPNDPASPPSLFRLLYLISTRCSGIVLLRFWLLAAAAVRSRLSDAMLSCPRSICLARSVFPDPSCLPSTQCSLALLRCLFLMICATSDDPWNLWSFPSCLDPPFLYSLPCPNRCFVFFQARSPSPLRPDWIFLFPPFVWIGYPFRSSLPHLIQSIPFSRIRVCMRYLCCFAMVISHTESPWLGIFFINECF